MTSILFLDFDGVLHPLFPRTDRSHEENKHFVGCSRLANILDRVAPHIQIVISSTWRYNRTIEQLKELVGPLGPRVIGCTPIHGQRCEGARELEALAWLEQYERNRPEPVQWCALDDIASLWTSKDKVLITGDGFRATEAMSLAANIDIMLSAKVTPPAVVPQVQTIWTPYDEPEAGDICSFGE